MDEETASTSNRGFNVDAQCKKISSAATTTPDAKNVPGLRPMWLGFAGMRWVHGPRPHGTHEPGHGGMEGCDCWIEERVWFAVLSDRATAEQTQRREFW